MAIGLRFLQFDNIDDITPDATDLNWPITRDNSFSLYFEDQTLTISYVDSASPFNTYTESYTVPIPTPISAVQVGSALSVDVTWGASAGSDNYLLQRDTNPVFPTPFESYFGPNTLFTDSVPGGGLYYYRVQAGVTALTLVSPFSDTASVNISTWSLIIF